MTVTSGFWQHVCVQDRFPKPMFNMLRLCHQQLYCGIRKSQSVPTVGLSHLMCGSVTCSTVAGAETGL
jgi:hypothetical protein